MTDTKQCTKCKAEKPVAEFYRNKRSNDGHGVWCKRCCTEHQRISRKPGANKFYFKAGGYRGRLDRAAQMNTGWIYRGSVGDATSLRAFVDCLRIGCVQREILNCVFDKGGEVTLDALLDYVYGDSPDPGDRSRQYNALKRAVFALRKSLTPTNLRFVNLGYGRGYVLCLVGDEPDASRHDGTCMRGHDLSVVGYFKNGKYKTCKECDRQNRLKRAGRAA